MRKLATLVQFVIIPTNRRKKRNLGRLGLSYMVGWREEQWVKCQLILTGSTVWNGGKKAMGGPGNSQDNVSALEHRGSSLMLRYKTRCEGLWAKCSNHLF